MLLWMYVCFCCVCFSFFSTKPRDWLGRTSPKWPILCRVGCKTSTQSIDIEENVVILVLVCMTLDSDSVWKSCPVCSSGGQTLCCYVREMCFLNVCGIFCKIQDLEKLQVAEVTFMVAQGHCYCLCLIGFHLNLLLSFICVLYLLLHGPFLLSYSVFILFFPYFFVSGLCARLSWPSHRLLSAR